MTEELLGSTLDCCVGGHERRVGALLIVDEADLSILRSRTAPSIADLRAFLRR